MSRGQRLTFLGIAVVIAIVAFVVLADSSEDPTEPSSATATPTAEATARADVPDEATSTPTPTPTQPPPPLLTAGKVHELEVEQGGRVRFRVRSDVAEEVHVHGYDIRRDLPAGREVTVSFPADITGIFEIELEHAHEQIAELKVEPE